MEALVAGLSNSDPQAACFAAAGVSAVARQGGAGALARHPGLPHALLAMAQAPSQVAVQRVQQRSPAIPAPALSTQSGGDQGRHPGGAGWSPGVALGVQRCGLRAMLACCQEGNPQLLGLLREGRVVSKPLQVSGAVGADVRNLLSLRACMHAGFLAVARLSVGGRWACDLAVMHGTCLETGGGSAWD